MDPSHRYQIENSLGRELTPEDLIEVNTFDDLTKGQLAVGYESVPPPDPSWLWPARKPFPPVDTVEGVQARLNYLDLGAGPVNGEWSELTRRAFVRWQVLNGLTPSGELDQSSIEDLAVSTPDVPD